MLISDDSNDDEQNSKIVTLMSDQTTSKRLFSFPKAGHGVMKAKLKTADLFRA